MVLHGLAKRARVKCVLRSACFSLHILLLLLRCFLLLFLFISIMRTWAKHDGYFIVLLSPRLQHIALHKNMEYNLYVIRKLGLFCVLSMSAGETTASQTNQTDKIPFRIFLLKQCEHKHPIYTDGYLLYINIHGNPCEMKIPKCNNMMMNIELNIEQHGPPSPITMGMLYGGHEAFEHCVCCVRSPPV